MPHSAHTCLPHRARAGLTAGKAGCALAFPLLDEMLQPHCWAASYQESEFAEIVPRVGEEQMVKGLHAPGLGTAASC